MKSEPNPATVSNEMTSGLGSFLEGRVIVLVGDITRQDVSAIVNAANSTLLGGGGVDGAIHRAGGSQIKNECEAIRLNQYPKGLPTGKAVITSAGKLPSQFVIHTVGPIYGQDPERQAQLLADCYSNSLSFAPKYRISTIAFPSISTGAFGYPKDKAAAIASRAIQDSVAKHTIVEQVRLVFFHESDARVFLQYQDFE